MDLRITNGYVNRQCFQVCCQERQCLNDTAWIETTVADKNNLTNRITVPGFCVGHQLYDLCYLWRETSCPFKEAAVHSGTNSNLPAPPYLKIF